MPTYSYVCKSCGHHFDAVQSFSDSALTVCPECGGELRKEYGTIGVTFHGSGFYRTDSRSSNTGTSDGASGNSSASSKGETAASPTPAPSGTGSSSPA